MAANNCKSPFNNSPRSRRPFMHLDLQNVPKNYTKVTFHQQCYKLVPDLSPDEHLTLTPETDQRQTHFMINELNECKSSQLNGQRRRRQLPEIPAGKKPFEKLWQRQIDRAKQIDNLSERTASSLEYDQKTTLNASVSSNSRWTRKLSTNMLLEIETDCLSGRALSLRLINDDEELSATQESNKTSGHFSPEIEDCLNSITSDCTGKSTRVSQDQMISHRTNTSDSGVSSNLQSPTISTNSECLVSTEINVRPIKVPEATHRALYKFCARHSDEIDLEIGDPIYVYKEYDDQWSDGLNIRTRTRGIFPTSLATDLDYSEFTIDGSNLQANLFDEEHRLPSVNFRIKRERFLLDFLGSIEVSEPKGEEVLNEAISRVSIGAKPADIGIDTPCQCVLEISDIGLRMMDDCRQPTKISVNSKINRIDYFFSLLQITYCGYRPKQSYYFFAFITRHPSDKARFACHVFRAHENTRDVAEAVGRAFHRFYNRFIEVTLPLETFYMDH